MRRVHFVPVVTLILSTLIFASGKAPEASSQLRETAQAQPTQPVKAKKVLVKQLPKELQGITLQDGVFKLQSGYKFVPKPNNTVAVALQNAGGIITGTFHCDCTGAGKPSGICTISADKSNVICSKNKSTPCSGSCELVVTITTSKFALAIF